MTNDFADDFKGKPTSPKLSLWQEGLRGFGRHKAEWLSWAAGFFFVLAAVCFLGFSQIMDIVRALPDKMPTEMTEKVKLLRPMIGLGLFVVFGLEFVLFLEYYFFMIFFARREMRLGKPVLGIGRFFYAFLKVIQMLLILLGVGLLTGTVVGVAQVMSKHGTGLDPSLTNVIVFTANLLGQLVGFYLAIRYTFVYPLAVCKLRPVLKTSWRLTKGNWWRLFWNKLVMGFILGLSVVALSIIGFGVWWLIKSNVQMPLADQIQDLWIALIMSFGITLIIGIYSAYFCVSCRILADEKRKADPSFTLTTPTV